MLRERRRTSGDYRPLAEYIHIWSQARCRAFPAGDILYAINLGGAAGRDYSAE